LHYGLSVGEGIKQILQILIIGQMAEEWQYDYNCSQPHLALGFVSRATTRVIMNKVKIEIYQGVLLPLTVEPVESVDLFKALLSDLDGMEIDLPIDSEVKVRVKIKQIKTLNEDKKKLWALFKTYGRKEIFLKFSSTIYFKDQDFNEFESEGISSNDAYIKYALSPNFEKRYYDFMLALDIARIGAFRHGVGLMYINDKFSSQLNKLNFHSESVLEFSLQKKWPALESLDILKTWDWYMTKAFPKGVDELPDSNLSRAINAFSHLYSSSDSEMEYLFWAMVGIEALYVEGKEGISEQVKRKAQIFLGEIMEHKRILTNMYNYRSSLVHGTKNFPNFFHIHDGLDSYEKFVEEFGEVLTTAQAVLAATLQKMAKLGLSELKFEYILKNPDRDRQP
jgi:Apea-like HEPN